MPLTDWPSEKNFLEQQKRQIYGHKRGLEFALEACKFVIEEIRKGEYTGYPVKEKIISEYLSKFYRAGFEEPVILTQNHYLDIPQETILERLTEIRQPVEQGIYEMASQAATGRKVKFLKLPVKSNRKIHLDDDVLSL